MKTKEELLKMYADKVAQIQAGTTPQHKLTLHIELGLLIEILGEELTEE